MFTYAEAESVLFKLHDDYGLASDEVKANAFRARLKHLRKLGIPIGSRPGRGKKVQYSYNELYQWAFCLEIAEFGIDPLQVSDFVKFNWNRFIYPRCFKPAYDQFRQQSVKPGLKDDVFFYMTPSVMSGFWTDRGFPSMEWFGVIKESKSDDFLRSFTKGIRRRCILNVSGLVRALAGALPFDHEDHLEYALGLFSEQREVQLEYES